MTNKVEILIVEDDTPLMMLMVSVLTQVGCDVKTAHTGKKAMELAADKKFDLIALDIELPGATEICCELKQRHISWKTPVIFISASPLKEDMAEAKKWGAVDYVIKPFDITEFVYKVVYHARAQHQLHRQSFDPMEDVAT